MNFFTSLTNKLFRRTPGSRRGIVYLGNDIDAGIVVDRETALEISTVFACINTLTMDIGQVPIGVYRYTQTGRQKAPWTAEGKAFRNGPNAYQTTQDWLEQVMLHLLTNGNHYSRIGRVGGYLDELYPIEDPDEVTVELRGGEKVFTYEGREISQGEIFHVHGPSVDGYSGRNFVESHRQTLSLGRALYRYGSRWFANGGQMRGILIVPGIKPESIDSAKAAFKRAYGTDSGLHEVAVYSAGTDYKPIDVDPEKAQALQTRQWFSREVAALYRIPLWKLYGEQPATSEARNAYYADCLTSWFVRITGNINRQLMPDDSIYAEFNTAALLRADIQTRYGAYSTGIQARFLNPNEVRAMENMDGYDGGEQFINPNTFSPADRKMLQDNTAGDGANTNA